MIVVGATMAGFVTRLDETCLSWLRDAEALRDAVDDEVRFFAALETDARGLDPFGKVIARLEELGGEYWTFELDDKRTVVDSGNRLGHICAGRNMITDYALGGNASHVLFLDADMAPDPASLPKLLEMNHPLVGGEVPTYDLRGPAVDGHYVHVGGTMLGTGTPCFLDSCRHGPDALADFVKYVFPVQEHWNTAGYLLVERSVFRKVRWRWDMDAQMTDDPCYAWDALHNLGVPTYVRKDCVGRHFPEAIPPVEQRGHDMTVHRRHA